MACRESEKAKKAYQQVCNNHLLKNQANNNCENVILEFIDLSDLAYVKDFVDRLVLKNIQLDVLINNAGVILSERKVTKDGFEMQVTYDKFCLDASSSKTSLLTLCLVWYKLSGTLSINRVDLEAQHVERKCKSDKSIKSCHAIWSLGL
jgi:hypothetical protein